MILFIWATIFVAGFLPIWKWTTGPGLLWGTKSGSLWHVLQISPREANSVRKSGGNTVINLFKLHQYNFIVLGVVAVVGFGAGHVCRYTFLWWVREARSLEEGHIRTNIKICLLSLLVPLVLLLAIRGYHAYLSSIREYFDQFPLESKPFIDN
jgi:hypothetical protein